MLVIALPNMNCHPERSEPVSDANQLAQSKAPCLAMHREGRVKAFYLCFG